MDDRDVSDETPRTGPALESHLSVRMLDLHQVTKSSTEVRSNARDIEDEFAGFYGVGKNPAAPLIEPTHNLRQLESLVYENNALSSCIEAMVTNIDGTGHTIEPVDEAPTSGHGDRMPRDQEGTEEDPTRDASGEFPEGEIGGGKPKDLQDPKKPQGPNAVEEDEDPEEESLDPKDPKKPKGKKPPFPKRKAFGKVDEPDEDDDADEDKPFPDEEDPDSDEDLDGVVDPETDPGVKALNGFFAECYPGVSFLTERRKVRRDVESIGNGYLEVIRDAGNEVVFLRHIDAKTMRIVRYDAGIMVERKIFRRGKMRTVNMLTRERRFAQKIADKPIYFKEFGASRDLDKDTGVWAKPGDEIPYEKRATEILHFLALKDPLTPYGIPRWITQVASVLGSRKAEAHNLSFFDAGGVPPILLLVSGGQMSAAGAKALQAMMNQRGAQRHMAQVLEVFASGGDINSAGNVRVSVERFGSERQSDSMFENYDEKCEARVRSSFRLPAIFVGRTDGYNYATAVAAYTVAEAQVFAPERTSFDERMNLSVLPAIGGDGYQFRSKPLNVKDSPLMMQGITIAQGSGAISSEELIRAINQVTELNLEYSPEMEEQRAAMQEAMLESARAGQNQDPDAEEEDEEGAESGKPFGKPGFGKPGAKPGKPGGFPPKSNLAPKPAIGTRKQVTKMLGHYGWLLDLAGTVGKAMRKNDVQTVATVMTRVKKMSRPEREAFNTFLTLHVYNGPATSDTTDLAGCLAELAAASRAA